MFAMTAGSAMRHRSAMTALPCRTGDELDGVVVCEDKHGLAAVWERAQDAAARPRADEVPLDARAGCSEQTLINVIASKSKL